MAMEAGLVGDLKVFVACEAMDFGGLPSRQSECSLHVISCDVNIIISHYFIKYTVFNGSWQFLASTKHK